tara:strand:+ start:312 stop:599 length:288 start_codon:yes stop_codon:yes gene_type:complete
VTNPDAYRTQREWISATVPAPKDFPKESVDHPDHYGGVENPYEAIKIIEAWDLNFHLGNVVKYVSRAGKKNKDTIEDLKKARWYIDRHIQNLEKK